MTGRTKDIKWRKDQLKALLSLLDEKRDYICDVLFKDLRKVVYSFGLQWYMDKMVLCIVVSFHTSNNLRPFKNVCFGVGPTID